MMKRLAIMALLMQIPALVALGETKEGSCQLKKGGAFDKDVFTVQVGQKIKGTCKFYIMDFLGKKIINANVEIKNTSDEAMHCQYYVAFFDKADELLGCAGQGTFDKDGLAAGKTENFGSCLIPLPAGFHEKAVKYKIAFYESGKEIGKMGKKEIEAFRTMKQSEGGAGPGSRGSRGSRSGPTARPGGLLALLFVKAVQRDLQLTPEQIDKLKEVRKTAFRGGAASLEELLTKMAAQAAETKKKVEAILTPEQMERLKEIHLQAAGPGALADPDVRKALNLTDEQVEKIKKLRDDLGKQVGDLMRKGFDTPQQRVDRRDKVKKLRQKGAGRHLGPADDGAAGPV